MPLQDEPSVQVSQFQTSWVLVARPEAVPEARHVVRGLNTDDRLELLTSELVTNAVMHGATCDAESILLCVAIADGTVLVEVWDEGLTGVEPAVPEGEADDRGGRGLLLVDALATRWGTRPEGGARCVWFELDP